MSLDLGKLEMVKRLGNGTVQARCPACAAGGNDKAGQHLRIFPDGRFGCCVFPKDREHRKWIFELAGEKAPRVFKVWVAAAIPPVKEAKSITASLGGFLRTARTGISESNSGAADSLEDLRTLRTPISQSRAYAREDNENSNNKAHTYKDWDSAVLSVLSGNQGGEVQPAVESQVRLPFFTADGTLSIPFDSPERYHWWKGGQSIAETRNEITERMSYAGEF